MSDLDRYTKDRAARDPDFAAGLESGYADFRIGVLSGKPARKPA